ncbi:class I SAM-dependent methyltransferase [Muriicola soli]|uniref:Class I SAM-dependent methyltransferase n=1 Tax=Muriicola soli TaxID=2507538 RepID=A0A411EBA8_9FLAO|nr:class I SAM-dependent methyltransferase [Muriicola soli]QBA64807.1 class I SAM-dependent methyltransferase [Muriicola soli]
MAVDVFGKAILDYHSGETTGEIHTFSSLEEQDSFPVSHLFRSYDSMPHLEKKALDLCRGRVLDIGCGAGSHSLYLQSRGFDVTSIDISPGAVQACKARGLSNVFESDFWQYKGETFDTLLLLMNGIGIAGQLSKLPHFFQKARQLLKPGGQLIFDSSDIIYMYEQDEDGGFWVPEDIPYYGELTYEIQYKSYKSAPFAWIFVDFNTLEDFAEKEGFGCNLVRKGDHFDYLAKLTVEV